MTQTATRRVVSLWLPRFATDRRFRSPTAKRGRRRASRAEPFALTRGERGRILLAAVNGAAAEQVDLP